MLGATIDGKYQVLHALGEGGMGAVYEARHLETGREVALKVIRAQVAGSAEIVRRFQREAKLAGALDTPHVVAIVDTGTDPATGVIYMAMELLKGEDLQKLLKRCHRLRPDLAARLVGQACFGLRKAHAAGVLHRDIKPANVFLSRAEDGEIVVKIVDFGIAKTVADSQLEETSLTRTGGLLGSPHYMSPEQAKGRKDIDLRSDIWSLGVVLYQALSGRTPHVRQEAALELMMRICTQPAPPIQDLAPWVPPGLALVVHRMLAINPSGRFQSMAEVIAAMEPWMAGGALVRAEELVPLPDAEAAQTAPRAIMPGDDTTERNGAEALARAAEELQPASPITVDDAATTRRHSRSSLSSVDDEAATHVAPRASLPASRDDVLPTSHGGTTLSSTMGAVTPDPSARPGATRGVRLLVALPVAFAIGIAIQYVYRLSNIPPVAAAASAPALSASAVLEPAPPRPPPVEERKVLVAIEPADATVEVDGQKAQVHDGTIELRGPLGSVHSVRLVKGSQETTAGVAITPVGALPARMRVEVKAPPKPRNPALNRKFE